MGQGPWRRRADDRLCGGIAGGIARRLGIDATAVRIVVVLLALAGGFGAVAYVVAWLLLPLDGEDESIGTRIVRDGRGVALALAFAPALVVVLVVGAVLHIGVLTSLAWPVFACAAGFVLVWRNCGPEERAWLHATLDPVVRLGVGPRRSWRAVAARIVVALVLLAVGMTVLAAQHPSAVAVVRPFIGAVLVAMAVVVLFGPWWLRLIRDLVTERQARVRAEERADMAARVHDSVLQTLAMIQRSSDQPQKVLQLARAQERELRSWLFDGEAPGRVADGATTVASGVERLAEEVEALHEVPVDVVTVGDCPLDDPLRAVLAAAREATVNAAKWSGAPVVALFAEVEPATVSVFVRDRGRGFDLAAVGTDRRGIAQSIQARMQRHGGHAAVRTAPGEGTEVELTMPRVGQR